MKQYVYGNQAGEWAVLLIPDNTNPPPNTVTLDSDNRPTTLPLLGTPQHMISHIWRTLHNHSSGPIQEMIGSRLNLSQRWVSATLRGDIQRTNIDEPQWQAFVRLHHHPLTALTPPGEPTNTTGNRAPHSPEGG